MIGLLLALQAASAADGPDEGPRWFTPRLHLDGAVGLETLALDRFWRSHGAHLGAKLEVYPALAVEWGASAYPLDGPTRLTQRLEEGLAAPLIADVDLRHAVIAWVQPLRAEGVRWRTVAGVGGGVAGLVPGSGAAWLGPVAGGAWGAFAEASSVETRLGVRVRVEGAVFFAGFPEEQEILTQLPLWVGVDGVVRVF